MSETIVIPAPGKLSETARALLDLASDPKDVRTDSNGTEFRVPSELADRYARATYATDEPAPLPKRRGRPPKNKDEVTD